MKKGYREEGDDRLVLHPHDWVPDNDNTSMHTGISFLQRIAKDLNDLGIWVLNWPGNILD